MAKRRNNGEGSIDFDARYNRWRARLWITLDSGERKRLKVNAPTRKQAADKLNLLRRAREERKLPVKDKQTVAEYLQGWLGDLAQDPRIRPKTRQTYAQVVRLHLGPAFGKHRLTTLTQEHVQHFINQKVQADNQKPRSIRMMREVLRNALNHAINRTHPLITSNPASNVRVPAESRPASGFYDSTEARAFMAAIKGHRLAALFLTAMIGGLRKAEVLGLRWEDVDLDRGVIQVNHTLHRRGGEWFFDSAKSLSSHREINLNEGDALLAALRAHKDRQEQERERLGSDQWAMLNRNTVFTTYGGGPLGERNVSRDYATLQQRAGLRRITFHDLRRTAASLSAEADVSLIGIQALLGHADIRTTANIYAKVSRSKRLSNMAAVNDLLLGKAPAEV